MSETIRLLVGKIIEEAEEYEWSLQGLGMFRLYLSRTVRLHVWIPSMAVPGVTTIHTHPWNFVSTVIAGSVIDMTYREADLELAPPTHEKQKIFCGPKGGAEGESVPVRLTPVLERGVKAGGSYYLGADELHETRPTEGAITIVRRTFLPDEDHAHVYFPLGTQWVSAIPRPATREEVGTMAAVAVQSLASALASAP